MALKLSRDERKDRDKLIERLSQARGQLDAAFSDYNETLEKAKEEIRSAVNDYNEVVDQATEFCQDVASRLNDEVGEKSDKWQEGERGQAALEWAQQWESVDLSKVDVDLPDELVLDDVEDIGETLLELPEEPSS